MNFSTAQLLLLRSLEKRGFEACLVPIFLTRCGATQGEWDAMLSAGLIEQVKWDVRLTEAGRKTYKKAKVGRYF